MILRFFLFDLLALFEEILFQGNLEHLFTCFVVLAFLQLLLVSCFLLFGRACWLIFYHFGWLTLLSFGSNCWPRLLRRSTTFLRTFGWRLCRSASSSLPISLLIDTGKGLFALQFPHEFQFLLLKLLVLLVQGVLQLLALLKLLLLYRLRSSSFGLRFYQFLVLFVPVV